MHMKSQYVCPAQRQRLVHLPLPSGSLSPGRKLRPPVTKRCQKCVSSAGVKPFACMLRSSRCDTLVAYAQAVSKSGGSGVLLIAGETPSARAAAQSQRLSMLVELRTLYRNILRAQYLLGVASPVYQPPAATAAVDDDKAAELEEAERKAAAVDIVADMQLTAEELKASLRALPAGFGQLFPKGKEEDGENRTRELAKLYAQQLRERAQLELPSLPFPSEAQAQQALDARNCKVSPSYKRSNSSSTSTFYAEDSLVEEYRDVKLTARERLEAAERVAEQFVERKIKPVLKRARESDLVDLVRESGTYLKGLWVRLNGGGSRGAFAFDTLDLPLPTATKKEIERVMSALSLDLDNLEKKLQEASKARETKLRKAGIQGRAQIMLQLKLLDNEVLSISRLLAVRTLQLETEYVYRSLEEEALQIADAETGLLERESSPSELVLLTAEFSLLNEQLAVLAEALDQENALTLMGDDVLERLAAEIPDMRFRVGVGDQEVFGGQALSLTKVQLQLKESLDKVLEGIDFVLRGVRLLSSDVGNAGRLFTRAALGGTLKAREVTALRRTARDLLTFIPFTIILIIPLTPLGHVLVFGFIQRYFPSFFPSQFSSKRQEIMTRYEDLEKQLLDAKAKAEEAEEEEELARAASAVARLMAPELQPATPQGAVSGPVLLRQLSNSDQAAMKVKELEEQLEEAMDAVHMDATDEADAVGRRTGFR